MRFVDNESARATRIAPGIEVRTNDVMSARAIAPHDDASNHQLATEAPAQARTRPAGITIGDWRMIGERTDNGWTLKTVRIGGGT